MNEDRLVAPGSFCWNPECSEYGRVGGDNVRKFGLTRRGVQRYQCRACKRTFTETRGTVFYGRHHSQETILECLALLAERNSLAALHRVKGIKEETAADWLEEAAAHVEQVEELLLARYPLSRVQLDALWAYVGHKGEKGGMPRRPSGAPSGGGRLSTSTVG
jgi:transposase-like protein